MKIAELCLDKKAGDVVVLEMKGLTSFTDYFVICSGDSSTQLKTIADHIKETLSKAPLGISPIGVEGKAHGRWVLMDYNDVVVHVFETETRDFYGLERLWLDAPRVPVSGSG